MLRRLDDIDLARRQGADRGLLVGHRQPFDAVDLGELAARKARRRLGARLVLGVPDVDGLVAGLPLVGLEDEGAGAHELLDLVAGRGLGDSLGHDEGIARGLGQRLQHHAGRRLEHELEGFGIDRLGVGQLGPQDLAQAIAHGPALQRRQHILRRDRLAVVEFQAVAQREGPGELVGRDGPGVDHLRLDLEVSVQRKQRVVDHVAVVADDEGRGPDRIEDLQVRMHDHAQRLGLLCGGGPGDSESAGGEQSEKTMTHCLSPILDDHPGRLVGDHDGRCVGVARRDGRHDRGVDHPEAF